eukprot:s1553_g28.t1
MLRISTHTHTDRLLRYGDFGSGFREIWLILLPSSSAAAKMVSSRAARATVAAVALMSTLAFLAPSSPRVAPPAHRGMTPAIGDSDNQGGLQLSASVGFAAVLAAAVLRRASITDKVSFDNIAREWRCKWSADDDKASLDAAQEALDSVISDVKSVEGVKSVQRVVCGGCLDFKVVVKLPADKFGDWENAGFAPEEHSWTSSRPSMASLPWRRRPTRLKRSKRSACAQCRCLVGLTFGSLVAGEALFAGLLRIPGGCASDVVSAG